MSDEVKFIFKTLIKVPVIIFVAFFILNIFSFFFIYFKVLGASYVVMQTAVENNYLPPTQLDSLLTYVKEWEDIPMCDDAKIVVAGGVMIDEDNVDTEPLGTNDARNRRQYGGTVTVGVKCDYAIIWPLDYRSMTEGDTGVNGFVKAGETGDFTGFKSATELDKMRKDAQHRVTIPITITYTVPGLKYYPDLN